MSADKALLVISHIGCGPPHSGSRARLRALLAEIRRLGHRLDFAGVDLSASEKRATLLHVDSWVASFTSHPVRVLTHRIWRAMQRANARIGAATLRDVIDGRVLDGRFHPHWLGQARRLQRRQGYRRVLVPYVFNSAFLRAFPAPCWKILDTLDVFTNRREAVHDLTFSLTVQQEREGLLRSDTVLAIQDEEARFFEGLLQGSGREIRTVSHFMWPHFVPVAPTSELTVGYVASDSQWNVDDIRTFIRECWPLVLGQAPGATLLIAGSVCRHLDPQPSLRLIGEVADITTAYSQCLFTVNPMRTGTGLKVKTVESLAMGRPVIGTPAAAQGLRAYEGSGLVVVSNASEFAREIANLLHRPQKTRDLGTKALLAMDALNARSRAELAAVLQRRHGPHREDV